MAQSADKSTTTTTTSSSRRRRARRRGGLTRTLAAAAAVSAAAALLVLPEPATAFLPAGGGLRRLAAKAKTGGWHATTLHNSEAFGNNNNNNNNNGAVPSPLRAASAEEATDLQHALFKEDSRRVILFDGDCGFCSEGVNIFLNFDGDPRGSFRFASLQGEIGQELLRLNNMDTQVFNTIVLVDSERIYTKSDAVLQIADKLREPFHSLAALAQVLPLETRDWCYGIVSRYRHIFGEKDSCRIPAEHEMERFLD